MISSKYTILRFVLLLLSSSISLAAAAGWREQRFGDSLLFATSLAHGECRTTPYIQTHNGKLFTGHYYQPILIPCPPVNEGVLYEFSFHSSAAYMMAASHQGADPTAGMSIWNVGREKSAETPCSSDASLKEPHADSALGVRDNQFCGQMADSLGSMSKLCWGAHSAFDSSSSSRSSRLGAQGGDDDPRTESFAIFNKGGCFGFVTLEAAVRDATSNQTVPVSCAGGIVDACTSAARSSVSLMGALGVVLVACWMTLV